MHKEDVLSVWDYIVVALTLCVSIAVGVYFRFSGGRQKSTAEYLMAGNNMSRIPVIFSLVVTKLSSIAMLGEPSEIYLYGIQRGIAVLSVNLGIVVSAYVFLPVFFSMGGYSVHKYLEDRFGKTTRTTVSFLWIIQTVLYMSAILYTPALALSVVTELGTGSCIVIIGIVCTLYSCMGGLKAVLWTDMFQAFLMYCSLLAVFIQGVLRVGGFREVMRLAQQSNRLELFDLSMDFRIQYTFWNSLVQGIMIGLTFYGVNQSQIHRLLSIKSLKNAQSAVLWSMIPSTIMQLFTTFIGIIMYAVYHDCNPLSEKSGTELSRRDQIVPYFIVSEFGAAPGVAGLCISGIFAGCLSSISSAVNSLSAATMSDFVKPLRKMKKQMKDSREALLAKVIGASYGVLIIVLAFLVDQFRSVIQATIVFNGTISAPVLGLFALGTLTLRSNERGVLIGLLMGVAFAGWIGFGSSLSKAKFPPLPLSDEGCPSFTNLTEYPDVVLSSPVSTEMRSNLTYSEGFVMHRISFMWVAFIGFTITVLVGYIASAIMGYFDKKKHEADPKLISPVARKILGFHGVQHSCGSPADEMQVFI